MVLDTDTYNEIDDQYALAYTLLSPDRLALEAIYAAPFVNNRSKSAAQGMEKSYEEILTLLNFFPNVDKSIAHRPAAQLVSAVTRNDDAWERRFAAPPG